MNHRYKAFISYSHTDESWARWMHRELERYRLPRAVREKLKLTHTGLRPIFRDRDELASSGSLDSAILDALRRSDALIVICSPAAAKSKWVNQEISEFCQMQRPDRVFCCSVEGDPPGVFPEAISKLGEPLAADFRKTQDGRRDGLTKLVAGLLGLGFDELRQREAQTRRRRQAAITAASTIGMVITTSLAAWAWVAQQQAVQSRQESESRRAQAENLLGFMVGDLRASLEPLGRLDLLDIVADQAIAYFKQPNIGEVTDAELTTKAKLLTQ
ncbi:MAG: toll/interleukin-1 receptor domain-containing protein, partial [Xanthomonadales bacterium]|nr:toll/interleukin-1 receptor domain-containing protein [Xanthomonadales bacterium]